MKTRQFEIKIVFIIINHSKNPISLFKNSSLGQIVTPFYYPSDKIKLIIEKHKINEIIFIIYVTVINFLIAVDCNFILI